MKTETFLLLFPVGECLFEIRVGKKSLNKILKKAKIIKERLRHSIRSKSSVQWVAKEEKINWEKIYAMPITTKKWLISRIYQNFYKSIFKQVKQHNRINRQKRSTTTKLEGTVHKITLPSDTNCHFKGVPKPYSGWIIC